MMLAIFIVMKLVTDKNSCLPNSPVMLGVVQVLLRNSNVQSDYCFVQENLHVVAGCI